MAVSGKTKEMVEALLLPHETRGTTIGSAAVVLVSIQVTSDFKCLLIYDSTLSDADALKCRTLIRWLMRDTGQPLNQLAETDRHIVLVSCDPSDEDTILESLENGGSSLHVFSGWADPLSSSILLCVRSLLHRIEENDPTFRPALSAEVERLENIGVFSTYATGEMKDIIFLASWVANRLVHKFGEIQNLNTITFGEESPSSVSELVDAWIDELFGEESEFHGIDMMQLSVACNDLVKLSLDKNLTDGEDNALGLNLDTENLGGKISKINLGVLNEAVKINSNTRLIYKENRTVPTPLFSGLTDPVRINLDKFHGVRIKVSDEADNLLIDLYSETFNVSMSGVDSIRGFYQETRSEWVYTDDANNVVYTPSLEEPFYSPDAFPELIVLRRNPPAPVPPPTWRDFILILEFQGQVNSGFEVYFKQDNIQPPLLGSPKWLYVPQLSEKVNFTDWQPEVFQTAVYSVRMLNHTLWDLDTSDAEQAENLTASYGAFQNFRYKIFSKLLYVK